MDKKRLVITIAIILNIISITAYAQVLSESFLSIQNTVCSLMKQVYYLIIYIASGLGAILIVVQSLTWITAISDTKARSGAKEALVHIILGLFIISMALLIVNAVLPASNSCISDWEAVTPPTGGAVI